MRSLALFVVGLLFAVVGSAVMIGSPAATSGRGAVPTWFAALIGLAGLVLAVVGAHLLSLAGEL